MFIKGFLYVKFCVNIIFGLLFNFYNYYVRREKKDALGSV